MMYCDHCEKKVDSESGFCGWCGGDLLGYGQPAVLEVQFSDADDDRPRCLVCRLADAERGYDVCDECWNYIMEDPDAFPEFCPACCSILLRNGRDVCADCEAEGYGGSFTSKGGDTEYDYDWWTGEVKRELPIPPIEEELELIPSLRKA